MIDITTILVPVDFSEPSKKALAYGASLATQFNAKLIVAHVVPESSALTYAFPTESFAIEQTQYEKAKEELRGLLPPDRANAVDLQTIARIGQIDGELLGIVKDESIDLVVMGTHGRGYAGRWFLGSITERMLRKVPVPVVTVSHVEDGKHRLDSGLTTIQRILYAADVPEPSPGMDYAFELAQRSGAALTIVHVTEFLSLPYGAGAHITDEATEFMNEMRRRFDEFLSRENPQGIGIETVVCKGQPYREILNVAEDRSIDLIVLNMHSKGVIERAFLGSTAERVVRLAHIPVLSVPSSAFALQRDSADARL